MCPLQRNAAFGRGFFPRFFPFGSVRRVQTAILSDYRWEWDENQRRAAGIHMTKTAYPEPGRMVRIISGPFKGLECTLVEDDFDSVLLDLTNVSKGLFVRMSSTQVESTSNETFTP